MGNWEDVEGSTCEGSGAWGALAELKPGDEVIYNRPIPKPPWYRPLDLWRWLRGDRSELLRLTVKESYCHAPADDATAPGSQE